MKQELSVKMVREAVRILRKNSIPEEPCGCQKVLPNVILTCNEHTVPLTQDQIKKANMNLQRFFCNLS